MIAVDANILVYAHGRDSPFFAAASSLVARLAEESDTWAIAWHCLVEYYSIVTNPGIYRPPSSPEAAVDPMQVWLDSPSMVALSEGPGFRGAPDDPITSARVVGPQVHDGPVAAVCITNGVTEFWRADQDFSRFPRLQVRNPLVG